MDVESIIIEYFKMFALWQFWVLCILFSAVTSFLFFKLAHSKLNDDLFGISISAVVCIEMLILTIVVGSAAIRTEFFSLQFTTKIIIGYLILTILPWSLLYWKPVLACFIQGLCTFSLLVHQSGFPLKEHKGIFLIIAIVCFVGLVVVDFQALKNDVPRSTRISIMSFLTMIPVMFLGAVVRVLSYN